MNPFDLKTVLLAKHAQHVVLIHFPIALFIVGAGFDAVAQRTKRASFEVAARYNLIAAAVAVPPVVVTGLLAWCFALGAPRFKGILLLHLVFACLTSVLILAVGWLHFRAIGKPNPPAYRLSIELLTVLLLALTAHLGGFLSGVNAG
jgi:uncharacterized membrane protein